MGKSLFYLLGGILWRGSRGDAKGRGAKGGEGSLTQKLKPMAKIKIHPRFMLRRGPTELEGAERSIYQEAGHKAMH